MITLSRVIDYDQMQRITAQFKRLGDKCYLDNAGTVLYPQSLLECVQEDLLNNVYMNPHSDSYTSDCIEQIRCMILKHFNTDPSNYTVIFTSGSTQSLRLIIESFQFSNDKNEETDYGSFMYLRDNHTSVLGMREIIEEKNVDVIHISHEDFLKSVNSAQTNILIQERCKSKGNTLFVYPAQNNFNGFKYPIDCIENLKNGCLNNYVRKHLCKINCNWYILLDAASYVSSNKLDLSKTQPDFVPLSFYKIFGYPTGLGALLVKNTSGDVLNQKKYFGGGTVDIALSSEDFHVKKEELYERFEDGTVSFLSIIALKHCFDTMYRMIPKSINNDPMETIAYHIYYLAKDLYLQLKQLQHPNGNKAALLYMDNEFTEASKQSGMVTFNLLREDGSYIGYAEFQHMADLFNIKIRTGCFCNSGSCQRHLKFSNKDMKDLYKAGHKCGDSIDLINGKPTGAIRVSFGYYNTYMDVDKLMLMICRCFVKTHFKRPKRLMFNYSEIEMPKTNGALNMDTLNTFGAQGYYQNEIVSNTQLEAEIYLKDIAIYPIKSCGALKIRSGWKIGFKGFEYDREWMIIKDNGVCLTQKQNTRMCMIRPKIDLKQKIMILNFKGKPPISIPLEGSVENKHKDASFCHSKVCSDIVTGYDCGDEVANWISEALEVSYLRLVRQVDSRSQKKKNDGEAKLLSLSNQAQFLLVNRATVRWLKDKITDSTFIDSIGHLTDRFRGNLIVEMGKELEEKRWQRVVIGKHEFKVEGQCTRCQMVCIDQQTGNKTVEPLRTISEQFAGKMRFGIYLSYVGTVDGSKDYILKTRSPIRVIDNEEDDDISR